MVDTLYYGVMTLKLRPVKWFRGLTDFAQQVLGLVLILILAALGWWGFRSYTAPQHVFEGMIRNNLSTNGVIRHSSSTSGSQKVDQYLQLSFVGPMTARNVATVSQDAEGTKSKVTTETIGTLTADYSRYVSVETTQKNADGKLPDFSQVKNVWGKTEDVSSLQYLNQGVLGIIPFGNINGSSKQELVRQFVAAYEVDYGKVKQEVVNGRKSWVYPVKLHTDKYVTAVKSLSKQLGAGDQPSLDPRAYQQSPPINLTIAVDKLSRQLVQVTYTDAKQKEDYSSYGITAPIALPTKTVPFADLQKQLQEIVQ